MSSDVRRECRHDDTIPTSEESHAPSSTWWPPWRPSLSRAPHSPAPRTSADDAARPRPPTVDTVAKDLLGPLSLDSAPRRHRLLRPELRRAAATSRRSTAPVSDDLPGRRSGTEVGGRLRRRRRRSASRPLRRATRPGSVWTARPDQPDAPVLDRRHLSSYEKNNNPDGDVTYGFINLPQSCLDRLPRSQSRQPTRASTRPTPTPPPPPAARRTSPTPPPTRSSRICADRRRLHGGRAPAAAKVKISRGAAEANGLPECTVGQDVRLRGACPPTSRSAPTATST